MLKEQEVRLLQHHQSLCNLNARVFSMNPLLHMVTVGHNAVVFSENRGTIESEATLSVESEGEMQCDTW